MIASAMSFRCSSETNRPAASSADTLSSKIRRRAAALLAVILWYLLLPNPLIDGSPDTKAPLSAWTQSGIFDGAADCEHAHRKLMQRAKQKLSQFDKQIGPSLKNSRPTTAAAAAQHTRYREIENGAMRALSSQCVSSDDPRLTD
jgi:hypothetical protein